MPASLKQINYLRFFVKALDYVVNNAADKEGRAASAVLYQLVIAGEIIAKQDKIQPKLQDELREQLSSNVYGPLQTLRDGYLVHSSIISNSKDEIDLLEGIQFDINSLNK
jgi:hypothetical protein